MEAYLTSPPKYSFPFNRSSSNLKFIQLNSDAAYRAEPIDVWGIGVILFTLMAGSGFDSCYS